MKKPVAVLLTIAMFLSLMTGLFTFSITSVAVIDDVPDYGVATSVDYPSGCSFSDGTLKLPGGTLSGNVTATSGVLTIDLNNQNTTITGYVRSTEGVVFTGSGSLTISYSESEIVSVDRGDIVFSSSGTITISDTAPGSDTNGGQTGRDCLVYVKNGGKIVFESGTVTVNATNRTAAVGGAPRGDLESGASTLTAVRMLGGTVTIQNSDVTSARWNAAIRAHSFHMIGGELNVNANYSGSSEDGPIVGIYLLGSGHASNVTTPTIGTLYFGGGTLNLDVSSNRYRPYGIYCMGLDRVLFDKPSSDVVTLNAKVVAGQPGSADLRSAVIAIERLKDAYATGDAGSRSIQSENSMAFHGGNFNLQSGTNVSFLHVNGGGKVVFYGQNWTSAPTNPYLLLVKNGSCRRFLTCNYGTVEFYPYGGSVDVTSTENSFFAAEQGAITFHNGDAAIQNDATPVGLAANSSTRVYFHAYPKVQINGGWKTYAQGSAGDWAEAYYRADHGQINVTGSGASITQIYSTIPLMLNLNGLNLSLANGQRAIEVQPVCHSMGFVDPSTDFSWAALKVHNGAAVDDTGTMTVKSTSEGYSAIHVEQGGVWITGNTVVTVPSSNHAGVQVATSSRDGFVQVDGQATLNIGNVTTAGIYVDCTAPSVRVKGSGTINGTGTVSTISFIALSTEPRYAGEAARAYLLLADNGTINVNSTVNKPAILFQQNSGSVTNVFTAELLLSGGTMTLANSSGTGVYMNHVTNGSVKITGGTHTIAPTGSGANGIRIEALKTAANVDITNGSAKFLMTGGSLTMNAPSNAMVLYADKSELDMSGTAALTLLASSSASALDIAGTTVNKNFGANMQYQETQSRTSGNVYKVNVGSTGTVTTVDGDSVFGSGVSLPKFGIAGVQIRTEDPTGMRFVAVVSEDRLAEFSSGTVSYGILMQDKDGAHDGVGYDGEMTAADVTDGNLSTGSAKPCKASYVMQYNTGYRYFTAVITNMPSSAYNQNIVARAYIRQQTDTDIIFLYSTENNLGAAPSVPGASYSGGGYCVSLASVAKHINTPAVKELYPEVFE